jgi:aminopeptidase N
MLQVALSNAPEQSSESMQGGKRKHVTFATTPVMSSYLVAFIIGPFTQVEGPYRNGDSPLQQVRVFAPTGLQEQGAFALTVAKQVMVWYEDTLQQDFPIAKLDLIAIPDFAAGAMENWGLVTYRQTALLINQAEASAANYQRVAIVVAHELAHQWFGDLVTTGWWSSLWLNEGFATFFETASLAALSDYADWALWDQFLVDQQQPGLATDALASSHPMDNPSVLSPDSISEMFDDISYAKSGSIIRMIQHWIGDQAFYAGLRAYQAQYRLGNTQSTDLFSAWAAETTASQTSSELVTQFLSWSTQVGFPVITATRSSESLVSVTQTPFTPVAQSGARLWNVPLKVRYKRLRDKRE